MTEVYDLTVLEVRRPKSRYQQDHTSSEICRGHSFLASPGSWCLSAILGNPWLADTSVLSHLLPVCLFSFEGHQPYWIKGPLYSSLTSP